MQHVEYLEVSYFLNSEKCPLAEMDSGKQLTL